jgi:hypothetical protein
MTDRLRYRSLKGCQGSWLIEVTYEDGTTEMVPNAHADFYNGRTRRYVRKNDDMMKFPSKRESWRERLYRSHKVVLTESSWEDEVGVGGNLHRKSYVGLFDIAELEENDDSHSFTITNRYQKTA